MFLYFALFKIAQSCLVIYKVRLHGFSFSLGFAVRAPGSTKPPCYAGYQVPEKNSWKSFLGVEGGRLACF